MEHKTVFDLCWDSSETLFLLLSKDFSIINLNAASEETFNQSKNELVGKKINSIFENYEQIFPKAISFSEKTQITTLHGDEKIKIVWEIIPLCEDIIESMPTFLMIGKINNRLTKKQQETLQFETLIKYAPGMFYWKNKEGVYQGCNDEFAKLANLTSRFDVEGKTDYELPWKNRAILYTKIDKEVFMTGKPDLNREETVTIANGQSVIMITNKVPLFNTNNEVVGLVGITVDITRQKKIEQDLKIAIQELEAANKTKTEFLENMRHDIRTPLVGITGFADIIKNEATDPKIKEYADNLIASSYSLLDLLNSVLESIKVSSGDVPLLKKKFNLKNKLREVISLNQSKANQKNLALLFEHDSAIPEYLIGDSTRIHRVILELVTNALNFTQKGQVKLLTRLEKKYKNEVIIKIIVEDTGIGIDSDHQQDIYVQFKRLIPSYEGIYKGTGLGLSIVKQFINELQGELYVASTLNVGSIFTCVLKLKKPLLNEVLGGEDIMSLQNSHKFTPITQFIKPSKKLVNDNTEPFKSHILVVEDSDIAAKVVINMLSAMNCKVDIADKGKLAVQLAGENSYDLIFMDIGLPDIDGYEVTKRIRLNEFNKEHVPIIALTAHVDEENKKHCINIGMNAVLSKPLKKENAEDILNSFIAYRIDKLNAETSIITLKSTSESEYPVLDFESIERQFGKKAAIEMLNMLVNSFPQELTALSCAYKANDWFAIQSLAHKLKGGVSYCGALCLREACSNLELAIKERKNQLCEELYNQLLIEVERAEKTIKEKLFEYTHYSI